ncbi:MAG: hypothetical protein ACOH2N_13570 [Devosia sp.]
MITVTSCHRALRRGVLFLLSIVTLSIAAPVFADDVTFVLQNNHPNAVEVQLYSQDRDHVWPGNDEVYLLDTGAPQNMSIACEPGETICYGAWVKGDSSSYWGTGPDNADSCESCCSICTGGTVQQINLNE